MLKWKKFIMIKKEYASKGVAGTALGLGIAGTALVLFNNGFGGNLFGCRGVAADGAVAAASIANERYLERKQCADHVQFVNDMWRTSYNQQNQRFEDRQTINQEMFGIYSAMRNGFDIINATANKNAFDLYKYSRDNKDELAGQIGELNLLFLQYKNIQICLRVLLLAMVKLELVFQELIKI